MVHNVIPKEFDIQLQRFNDTIEKNLPFSVTPGEGPEYFLAKSGAMMSFLNVALSRLLQSAPPLGKDVEPK